MTVLTNHVVDLGVHVVGYMHDLRVALVGALGEDHLYKLGDNIDIRVRGKRPAQVPVAFPQLGALEKSTPRLADCAGA